jgi:hypothetical protein
LCNYKSRQGWSSGLEEYPRIASRHALQHPTTTHTPLGLARLMRKQSSLACTKLINPNGLSFSSNTRYGMELASMDLRAAFQGFPMTSFSGSLGSTLKMVTDVISCDSPPFWSLSSRHANALPMFVTGTQQGSLKTTARQWQNQMERRKKTPATKIQR